eukprot:TRINITY_DN3575_c0_g1_i3.p1 TRINITY_DN3575_c0_g1~~TRINITY_DN3575_c0_g1_i3.p1  ORF type:complete len:231 (-),score=73.04 TRINITY_DN3575_c0_g1_i3:115-807(-)
MAQQEEPSTLLHVELGVATITLNRPQEKNSLGVEIINELGDHLAACMANEEVRTIVLTNNGNTFCAGANLKRGNPSDPARYNLVEILTMIQDGPKVVVAKINGHITGGGVGLAAACDLSVIIDSAKVGFTEVRIGVAPAIISVVCLPKMRRGDAAELMLSGEKIMATRAVEVGLLNYAVPADSLDSAVTRLTDKLVRGCLLYTSDAADEEDSVDLGGRRIIKKKKKPSKR